MERLSRTGLVIPDRVPWGTHLCQFYETKDDLLEVLVPYFKEGLAANESCLWITSDPLSVEQAQKALRAAVPELDHYLATGQMEIIAHDTWYLTGGSFNIDTVLTAYRKKAEHAFSRGYGGLRVTGNAGSLQDDHWADLVAYEDKVQSSLHAQKIIALCSYPLDKCTASQFLQAVNSHDRAIVRRQGRWECLEGMGGKHLLNRLSVKEHALASSISPMVMTDLAGNLTYANPAALKAWGYETENQVLDRHAAEFWQDPDQLMAYLERVRASSRYISELVARRKDSSTFTAEVLGSVTLDDKGQPIGIVASCLDVTVRKEAEARLRESECRYRTLVENINLGITLMDRDHRVLAVNGFHTQMIGRSRDNCIGQKCFRVFEKREAVCPHCPGTRALETGKPAEVETVGVRDDGTTYAARVQAYPVLTEGGGVQGFIEVVEDITDRKQEQEHLRRANFCIEQGGDSVFWIDPEGRIIFANQKACEVLEYSSEELQAMTVFDINPTITRGWWGPHWEAIREKKSFVIESCHRTKTGRVFPVEISVNYMTFDGKEYNCTFARDISERKRAEETLAHFSAIVDSSQDAIIGGNLDGMVTSWNPGAERLYGYTASEMIGQPTSALLPPDRPGEISRFLAILRHGGRVKHFDTVRRRKNGTLVDVSVTYSPIEDNEGKVIGVSAIAHEITDRKQAEDSRRESEERLRNIIHNASEIIYTLSLDGVLTFVSPAWARKLGHNVAEVEGHRFDGFVHPDDVPACWAYLQKVASTDEPQQSLEYRIRHKNGGWHWHQTSGSCVKDREGQPAYCVGVAEDITEQKRAQEVLRESEERYRCLVENVDLGITLIDRQHRIVMVNEGHARMFKRTARECIGQECYRMFERREAVCPHCPGVSAMTTGCPAEVEAEGKRDDGSTFAAQLRAFPVRDSHGTTTGFIEVVEDITDRKRTEQELTQAKLAAEAANRSKSEFLANMSHEIRTPMTAILGFADILLGEEGIDKAPPDRIEAFRTIQRNGQHLLELINDILDLSKIEAGKQDIDFQVCSPRQLVSEVISTMQVRADAKGLSLSAEYRGGIPLKVRTDPVRLRQILVNLLGNAIKFTEVGSVRLVVRSEGAGLQFDIIDTGIGIAQEHLALLFQPFSQADASARRRFGGTGLGLVISKRLAGMLGGDITVSSDLGKGTTFSVSIITGALDNAESPEHSGEIIEQSTKAQSDFSKLNCHILLAEDGPDNQRLIAYLLRKAGAEVTVVDDGRKAMEHALDETDGPFDLILMDMQMPVMDGYEATRELREMGYRGPILALTAHAMKEDRQKCLDAGCDDYVTKPVGRQALLQLVSQYVARSRSKEPQGAV